MRLLSRENVEALLVPDDIIGTDQSRKFVYVVNNDNVVDRKFVKLGELHTQHNFEGFILNKIPLLNKLNFHTVIGAKAYFSGGRKPYTEYSIGLDNIGWGKWRFLRLDFVFDEDDLGECYVDGR